MQTSSGSSLATESLERALRQRIDLPGGGRLRVLVEGPDGACLGVALELAPELRLLVAPLALCRALEAEVSALTPAAPEVVLLVPSGALSGVHPRGDERGARELLSRWEAAAFAIYRAGELTLREPEPESGEVSALEAPLAAAWCALLGVERARPNDGFFALGGDSLKATELAARASEICGRRVEPRVVFARPRFADFVAEVSRPARDDDARGADTLDGGALEDETALTAASPEERAQLSPGEQRLWVLWQLEPTSAAYNLVGVVGLAGELDRRALERALEALSARHAGLRARFPAEHGTPRREIAPPGPVSVALVDASPEVLAERGTTREALLDALAREPFDLERGPLFLVTLARLGAAEHALVFRVHHIVADAGSLDVLLRELLALYAAEHAASALCAARSSAPTALNAPPSLPALAADAADYAAWQRRGLPADELERRLAFWRARLSDEVPLLEAGERDPEGRDGSVRLELPGALSDSVRRLARERGTTVFHVLLGALELLLARHTRSREVRVGVPVSRRERPELAGVVGFLVDTWVVPAVVDPAQGFARLIDASTEFFREVKASAELPFERLVDALNPVRSADRNPLFQVLYNHLLETPPGARAGGLEVVSIERRFPGAQLDLALDTSERAGSIAATFTYRGRRFSRASVQALAEQWRSLLESGVAEPERRVDTLPLVSPAEQARFLTACNATACSFEPAGFVPELMAAQAARTPDARALVYEGERRSYRELAAWSRRVAARLHALGAGPERLVGVCLERSLELVPVLLGVLEAGAAYVPLDPELPRERLLELLDDARPALVLTTRALAAKLPETDVAVVPVDDWEQAEPGCDGDAGAFVPPRLSGEQLAYCIFTSGSTGRPKGALNTHAGLRNRLLWMQREYQLTARDVVLQKTPFGFDVSVWELFWPLLAGATLVVAAPGAHKDPRELATVIAREGVTLLHFVPSMLRAFVGSGELPRLAPIRAVVSSGEELPKELVRDFRAQHPAALHNLYGPTEASIDVSSWECVDEPLHDRVPIGKPIANCALYVLDERLAPLPPGAPGELYIGGVGLARGYTNRPELTAERFVPSPFGAGERLYRTGDLARYRADGALEYLGRVDQQVKLRGFRIELGEIEARLREDAWVGDAAVALMELGAGQKQLVAYLVPSATEPAERAGAAAELERLRARLAQRLPDYMLPSRYVLLERLPLTTSGKLDRRALPRPAAEDATREISEPVGPIETTLAAIWREVLGLERVGRDDNFFERGGDSIVALQVVGKARAAGLELTARDLFQHQSLSALALAARAVGPARAPRAVAAGPVPLSPIQRWWAERPNPEPEHHNQAVLLTPARALDLERLERALSLVVARHAVFRLRYRRGAEGWEQEYVEEAAPVRLERVDLRGAAERRAAIERAANEAQRGFDLERGPLMRALYLDFEDPGDPGRVLLVVHHLIVDGVSWRVLLEELGAAAAGQTLPEPEGASYGEWVEAIAAYAEAPALAAELAYWQGVVAGGERAQRTPGGEPTRQTLARRRLELSPEETEQLFSAGQRAYRAQAHELLLTALARVWCAARGERELFVELEGHGREAAVAGGLDVSRTVGWFTARYPVRLAVELESCERSILGVKEQLRAVPNHGVGYGVLRYCTEAGRVLASGCEPAVVFNYLGRAELDAGDGALFRLSDETVGELESPRAAQPAELELNALVRGGRLSIEWVYNEARPGSEGLSELAERYLAELRALAAHVALDTSFALSPSDFPLAGLTRAELDALAVPARAIDDIFPLSPLQHGLLLHTLLEPRSGMYVMQDHYVIESALDPDRFLDAWQRVLERHAALRASFWALEERPLQIIAREVPRAVEYLDLAEEPPDAQEKRIAAELEAELERGFDLERAPLCRFRLVRLAPARFRFVHSYHHILIDAWCRSLLWVDFFAYYSAALTAAPPRLPAIRPYRDFIAWLGARDLAATRAYWGATLAGVEAATPLGIELVGAEDELTGAAGSSVADQSVRLSPAETERLTRFGQAHALTLNTLAQGAWALLLAQYGASDDVVFGVTVAGRPAELSGVERTVGLFINSIPLRVRLPRPGAGTVLEWLGRLQADNLAMREHEHLPLVEIQALTGVPRGQSLFESLFVFENAPLDASLTARDAALGVSFAGARTHTNYPLTVVVIPGEGLTLQLTYDARRFAAADVERMLGAFRRLLLTLPEAFEHEPALLARLSDGEQRALEHGEGVRRDYPFEPGYAALFEAQARRHPARVAATSEGVALTYGELSSQASAIASALVERGAGPERIVGVLASRGLGWLSATVGVLHAGAVYLPLDPQLPAARLAQLLALSGARLVLTARDRGPLAAEIGDLLAERAPDFVELEATLARPPRRLPPARVPLLGAAYAIYTSGSTGEPKAAVVTSQGMLNNQLGKVPFFGLGPSDVIAQTAAPGFDISIWQLLTAPLCGARVEIVPDAVAQDPVRLLEYVERTGITVLEVVPALIAALLSEAPVPLTTLRWLMPTGEALAPELARQWLARYPHVPLVNAYGPAECADDVALERIDTPPALETRALPIGTATDNNRLYVLDRWLLPLPPGVVGELYVAGVGVGRGYLGDAARSAEAFLPNPFAREPGERLYRTGDRARRRADGRLEYVGRVDQQVKIRGQRIELGEIEARLSEHPALEAAAVVARRDAQGALRLIAYLVPSAARDGAAVSDAAAVNGAARGATSGAAADERLQQQVSAWLAARLPAAMVPAHFVVLSALPLSANGKVDRRALSAPAALARSREHEAPCGETEQRVAEIWQAVLKLPRVGRGDHFFELGGHSLLATQVTTRVARAFEVELPLRALFEASTLSDFAARVDAARVEAARGDARSEAAGRRGRAQRGPELRAAARPELVPLSFAQKRLWFLWKLDPASTVYNLTEAARWTGAFDACAVRRAFDAIVRRHEVLRTTFVERGGEAYQRVREHQPLSIPLIDARDCPEHEREALALRLAEQEASQPFDLERDMLIRAKLVELADDDHLVLVTAHHIVSDGWSMHLIVDEFAELYAADTQSRAARLPELTAQYADYALWEGEGYAAGELERELEYWKKTLGDEHPLLELPADRPRPARQSHQGKTFAFDFEPELSERLRRFALEHGLTPFSLSLGVFSLLLGRLARQKDVRVGVPVANRARLELEPLVGFFVNTHVFRTTTDDDPTFLELMRRVHAASLDAQAHQNLPFERLVEALNPARSTSHSPLFQVLYNHVRPEHDALYTLPGVQIRWLDRRVHATQFDLTVHAVEEGERLRVFIVYATDLFDAPSIERLAASWRCLLEGALGAPEARVSRLPLQKPEDDGVVLSRGRGAVVPREGGLVHGLFEAQAARTPDAPALTFGDETLTYAELNARANRLARALVRHGVGPEVRVALFLERSLELLVALLGVMKAGGAYVPIDPDYPAERVALMLDDSAPALVLSLSRLAGRLGAAPPVWCLDALERELESEPASNLSRPLCPSQAVYCIYTSGSTGRPKGALNHHAGVHNRIAWMLGAHRLGPGDRLLQKTPYSFDVSGWELYWPLAAGATLVLAPPGAHREPAELRRTIVRHSITALHFVPSMLQAFLQAGELERCPSVREVYTSGEALTPELAQRFFRASRASLVNLYGPTEASIEVSAWALERAAWPSDSGGEASSAPLPAVPIGHPIDNAELFVLDEHLRPLPTNVVGELYLGGVPLARGYHRRPDLTAERFVPSPFGAPGARLYRTGDLARQRADGAVEYAGRTDQQVKIRGFRIELGEIEARLLEQPGVREAALTVDPSAPGGPALVAYVVLERAPGAAAADDASDADTAAADTADGAGSSATLERLRAGLRRALPEYMVPAHFVWLERLPLTSSGKLDRKALPAARLTPEARAYVAPRSELEARLAALWAEVLKVPRVGVHDNFFELGGHSLLVMQIVSRVRDGFGVELPVSSLFQADSVAALAALVERELAQGESRAERDAMQDLLDELELAP